MRIFNVIREVRMCKDGTLAFVPVEEMEKIRENKFTQQEIQVTETPQQLKAGDGISFEMKFTLDLEETDADRVELKLRCGKEKESRCIFDLKNGELLVDRSCADGWSVGTSRSVLKVSEKVWMYISFQIRVLWRYLQINTEIIIPIIFLQEMIRMQ